MITKANIKAVKKISKLYLSITERKLKKHIGSSTTNFKNFVLYKNSELCPGCATCISCKDCCINTTVSCIHQKSYKKIFRVLITEDNIPSLVKAFHSRGIQLLKRAERAERKL